MPDDFNKISIPELGIQPSAPISDPGLSDQNKIAISGITFDTDFDKSVVNYAMNAGTPEEREDILTRLEASKYLAQLNPQYTREQVFSDFDKFAADYNYGAPVPTKTLLKVLIDNIRIGDLSYANGKMYDKLRKDELFGGNRNEKGIRNVDALVSGSFGVSLKDQIAANNKEIERLSIDRAPETWQRTFIKTLGQTIPSIVNGSLQGATAALAAATVVGAGAGVAGMAGAAKASLGAGLNVGEAVGLAKNAYTFAGNAISVGQYMKVNIYRDMLSNALTYAQGVSYMRGNDYGEMLARGYDPKISARISSVTGALDQVIEQNLGVEQGVRTLFSGTAVGRSLVDTIAAKIHVSGILQPIAAIATKNLLSTAEESAENVSQAVVSGVGMIIAGAIQDKYKELGKPSDPITIQQIAHNSAEALVQSLTTTWLFSLPLDVATSIHDYKAAKVLIAHAGDMSKDSFIEAAKEQKIFGEAMSEDKQTSMASDIWESSMEERKKEQEAIYTKAKEAPAEGQVDASRTPGGGLAMTRNVSNTEGANQTVEYAIHSADRDVQTGKPSLYGTINTTFNSAENTLTINGSDFETHRVGLLDEALQEVMFDHPGAKVVLGENIDAPTLGSYERLTSANPRGKEAGPSWVEPSGSIVDEMAKVRMRNELSKVDSGFQTLAQREALIYTTEKILNAGGIGFAEGTKGFGGISYARSEALKAEGKAGAFEMVDIDGNRLDVSRVADMTKGIIYLAENTSNYAAVRHEMEHYVLAILKQKAPEQLKELEAEVGVKDGVWTDQNIEDMVDKHLAYEADRTSVNPKLAPIFARISKWLHETWSKAVSKLAISDNLRKRFEAWDNAANVQSKEGTPADVEEELPISSPVGKRQAESIKAGRSKNKAEPKRVPINDDEKEISKHANEVMLEDMSLLKESRKEKMDDVSSVLEERIKRFKSGEWLDDPQLVAEVRSRAGLAPTEADQEVASLAAMEVGDVKNTVKVDELGNQLLFMSDKDIKDNEDNVKAEISRDASHYDSVESWVRDGLDANWGEMSDEQKKWFQDEYDYLKSGKKRQFDKRGDFTRFMASQDKLTQFIKDINNVAYSNEVQNEDGARQSRRVRDLISESPEITNLVDAYAEGKNPSAQELTKLAKYVRRNEPIMKMLYAEVHGDKDLMQESLVDMKQVPELRKHEFAGRPGRTIADQIAILKNIKDDSLVKKIQNREATMNDIGNFAKMMRSEGKDSEREKNAAIKVREYMRKLQSYILKPASSRMDNNNVKLLSFIQDFLDNTHNGEFDVREAKSLASIVFQDNPSLVGKTIDTIQEISKKDFKDWNLGELEDMADIVQSITRVGRAKFREWEIASGEQAKILRYALSDALKKSKLYVEAPAAVDSVWWNEQEKKAQKHWRGISAMLPHVFFNGVDRTGMWKDVFVNDYARAYSEKFTNFDRRVNPLLDFIEEKNISKGTKDNPEGIFRKVVIPGLGKDGGDLTCRAVELLGIKLLAGEKEDFNPEQREAVIYGNFFSNSEKDQDGALYQKGEHNESANAYMRAHYQEKLDKVLSSYSLLTADEKKLGDMMLEVMNDRDDWRRFTDSVIKITGKEMTKSRRYFPIRKMIGLVEKEDAIADELVRSGVAPSYLETGATLDRIKNIQPRNQAELHTDAFKVFFDAIENQEHLINVGPWAKKMRMVFSSDTFGPLIREQVQTIAGRDGVKYINDYLDAAINPAAMQDKNLGDKLFSTFRGRVYVGCLAYRLSTVLTQLVTSPMPFIADAPLETIAVAAEAYTSGSPKKWYQEIEKQSTELRHREMDPRLAEYKNLREIKERTKIAAFGQKGMDALVWADKVSVAIGWEAVRRKKYAEFVESGLDENVASERAKDYANQIVRETQPTSEAVFRSPLYRNMDTTMQTFLQFTQPLNVIWNNVRYDVPHELIAGSKKRAVGLITAYALSGLAIGAIRAGRKALVGKNAAGVDEGDDEEAERRKWRTYWMLASSSQFTSSIPIIGDVVSNVIASAATGTPTLFNDSKLPLTDDMAQMMQRLAVSARKEGGLTDKDLEAILRSGFEGATLYFGLPGSGITEAYDIGKAALRMFGDKE